MKLSDLFQNITIIEVEVVESDECENWYRLYVESATSDALFICVDVVKEAYESLEADQFFNGKKIDYVDMKVCSR